MATSLFGAAGAIPATPSNIISYTQGGTGSITSTVETKLRESVSVKDFGAVGDGIRNDTAAIQAAHDSLPARGGRIFIPAGSYLITSPLIFTNLVFIEGEGTHHAAGLSSSEIVKASGMTSAAIHLAGNGQSVNNLAIRGLAGNTGDGIQIRASRVTLENVSVYTMGGNGIRIGTDAGNENNNLWNLSNVRSKSNGGWGLKISEGFGGLADANGGSAYHLDIQSNGGGGIYLGNAQLNSFFGATIQSNTGYGIQFSDDAKYNVFFGGDIEGSTINQVRFEANSKWNAVFCYVITASSISEAAPGYNRLDLIDRVYAPVGYTFPPLPGSTSTTMVRYADGTFTPTISGTTTAGVGTYTTQSGTYTLVGNICHFTINIAWTAHTGVGNTEIAGLPFVSVGGNYSPISILQSAGPIPAAGTMRSAFVVPGSSKVGLREVNLTTMITTNNNGITATGTMYINGSYRVV